MYINKIDDLIDKIIDDFGHRLLHDNKMFKKMLKDENFVKYQMEVNKLLKEYSSNIDIDDIKERVTNPNDQHKIIQILLRYIAYYLFLATGYFYTGKRDTYMNNVIEFSRNQPSFNFRINNFFNSENNSNLITYYDIVKNTVLILSLPPSKLAIAARKAEMKPTIEFLNGYGQEYVVNNFKLENVGGDRNNQCHNIIKTLILNELYLKQEKSDMYAIIDTAEKKDGVYTYINIVLPRMLQVDYAMIEKGMSEEDVKNRYAMEVYNFLQEDQQEQLSNTKVGLDEKILKLINKKLIIPISEDYLMYHKDTERYEKIVPGDVVRSKKKEDTKIRYIINKVGTVSEYFSERAKNDPALKRNIEKLFYVPLFNQKAVLMNEFEEVSIISKFINQGSRSTENNEQFNDLIAIRRYPYLNFKDFSRPGISLKLNKTINVIRSVALEKDNLRRSDRVPMRIGSDEQILNIVGIAIPGKHDVMCTRNNRLMDVLKTKYSVKKSLTNGYEASVHELLRNIFRGKSGSTKYWMFNPKDDKIKMDNYVQVSKMSSNDSIKLMLGTLHDDLLRGTHSYIKKELSKVKEIAIADALEMVEKIEKKLFMIPVDSKQYKTIRRMIFFDKYIHSEDEYDKEEDIFYGMFGNVTKLPSAPPAKKVHTPTIKIRQKYVDDDIKAVETEAQKAGALCQHHMTWDMIHRIKRANYSRFTELLYEFIQQYVIESHDHDFVCKSCGTLINIKKYVPDGMYDNNTQKFVTLNMPMEVQLEDLPEYAKYRSSIRNIEKLVERICSVTNLTYYVGSSVSVKMRRKSIVKQVVDMLLIHNRIMLSYYRQRSERVKTEYGINQSSLFIFELEDSIFVYSSKEKDYYKDIKYNNIVAYTALMVVMELNRSQILYIKGDKGCNYFLFSKFGHMLFDGLKVRINSKGDTKPVTEYPVLCYTLFMMGCFIAKYNIWHFNSDKEHSKQARRILIQKAFVHTVIDILNSLLEIEGANKEKHYQYEMFQTKFHYKLTNLLENGKLLDSLKAADERKLVTIGNKKRYIITKVKGIPMTKPYEYAEQEKQMEFEKCPMRRFYVPKRPHVPIRYTKINNLTTSPSGEFYDWVPKNGTLIDSKSGIRIEDVKINSSDTTAAVNNYKLYLMKKLAEKYCLDGKIHNYVYNQKLEMNQCRRCKFKSTSDLTNQQLLQFEKVVSNNQMVQKQKALKAQQVIDNKYRAWQNRTGETIKQLKSQYAYTKDAKTDYFAFVDKFVDKLRHIIGTDTSSSKLSLLHNLYIINHDHNGNLLGKNIYLSEKDGKIKFKENHSFFKTDVIYYTNLKQGKIDVYYDAITHVLLGYKESHRDFVANTGMRRYIKIRYSLRERIKMIGYPSKYINLQQMITKITSLYGTNPDRTIKRIIADISRERIIHLKRVISDLQKSIHQIKYGYNHKINRDEDAPADILDEYRKKITKIRLKDEKGQHKAFKRWNDVASGVYFYNLENRTVNIDADAEYISTNDVSKYDYHGNLILFYIIDQLDRIVSYNPSKFNQINVVNMIITLLNHNYEQYSDEELFHSIEMKRFYYRLKSFGFVYDIEQKGHGLESTTEGFYGEYKDADDKPTDEEIEDRIDMIETEQALDVSHVDPEDANDDFADEFESAADNANYHAQAYGG